MLKTTSKVAFAALLATSPATLLAQTEGLSQGASTQGVEGQIVLQSDNTILAHDLLGAAVYTPDGDSVGDINDLLIDLDGTVAGVVIGVGGFLGIGEKAVAVQMDKLNWTSVPDGAAQLILSTTKEELQAAPAFKTVDQQRAEQNAREAEDAMRSQPQGTAVDPLAPADGTQSE